MKAFRSLIFLVVANLLACAQPNYGDPTRDPAANAAGHCELHFTISNLCADLIWENEPTTEKKGQFVLEFYLPEDRGQFVDLQEDVNVVLWMASMNPPHGSTPVKVEKLAPGQYRVSDVYFIMPGNWDVRVELKKGANVVEQAILAYRAH